jgi:serine/threonine protein kinase/Tfp pilus assembly protein PilF
MSLAVGARLGPFEVLGLIGAGGMGEVYKARDTRLDRTVAVKVLPPEFSNDPRRRSRFEREAKTIAGLSHPHICTLHDVGEHDGAMFLVMELLEGEPLRTRLSQARLPVAAVVEIALQLADALECAHAKGIVHRDIKPENIFITPRGAAKLLDFGIAKQATQQADADASSAATRVPTEPPAMGTVAYMSPEQVRSEALDARTDLFSLGVVLYEMATGTAPFRGATSGAVLGEILTKAPTAPVRLNPEVPADLERLVNKLLEKDRELRYQSARDLRVDLERLRRALTEPAMADRPSAIGRHGRTPVSAECLPSIAVLPFVNMSGDKEQEYFSDGLAEEAINVLSRIPGLKVIARTSAFAFKGKQEDVRTIAGALGVANILEGSVRKAGNRVRVTAQLVAGTDGSHLWSERYDRELTDIFAIQDDIAAAIAGALQVKLSVKAASPDRRVANLDAYESYLKALYLLWKLSPEALARCRECLERAIALDPGFALAHVGLAQHSWILASMGYVPAHEAMPMVRTEAEQALTLDPGLADAQVMLGIVAAAFDYDWEEAERRFQMAMSHDPVPSNAHSWYAYYCLLPTGRTRDAVDHAKQALVADPLNISARIVCGTCLNGDSRPAEARAEARQVLAIEENQMFACTVLVVADALEEKWAEAREAAERASPRGTLVKGMLAGILKRMGGEQQAERIVQELMTGQSSDAPLGLGWYYGIAGELDKSAEWFGKVAEQRHPDAAHHAFLVLRTIPRWPALARLMHLPESSVT